MLCGRKSYWIATLIILAIMFPNVTLCEAQSDTGKIDYVAELNKLGMAGRPESDNAAPFYQKAIELYVEKPTNLNISIRTQPKELPAQEQAMLRKWVQDNNAALEQLQLGSQKPYCWFTQTRQISQADKSPSASIRNLAMVLDVRAMLQAEEGGVSGAISDIETLYKFGAHNEAGPRLLVEKLTGIAIKSMAVVVALNILSETAVNVDLMKGLQEQLEQLSANQNKPFDVRGEKIYMQGQIETDPKYIAFKPYFKNALEYYDTIAAKTPWQLHTEPAQAAPSDNPLMTDMAKIIEVEYRSRADTQALITTLAVLRYKSDKGGYPAELGQLVSAGFLKEPPIDPFSNKPLVYKQTKESFTLYSFGVDYDDDGGKYSRWGSGQEGGDQVFWPVQAAESEGKQQAAEQKPERKLLPGPEQEKLNESLHHAVIARDIGLIESLISQGADVNAKNRQSFTALHTAIMYSSREVVELLISKGADVGAQDNRGNTPLYFACIKGDPNAAGLIIAKGANINAKNSEGQTPLYAAVDAGFRDVVELLITKGADINAQVGNDNALSLAQKKGNSEIADLLLKSGAKEPVAGLADERLGPVGQTPGLSPYVDYQGQLQGQSSGAASSRAADDMPADPNEIKNRIKTYEGMEKALEEIDGKSRTEKGAWLQRRIDNRTGLSRLVEEQVKLEMAFVRNIAVEEKAEKTTKAIDGTVSGRDNLCERARKELLVQRRDQQDTQRSSGRSQARTSRGTRGRGDQEGYQTGQQPGQELTRREAGPDRSRESRYARRGEPNEGQQLDSETQSKINQWLEADIDNKEPLLKSVYSDVQAQYAFIRDVAVEENAKKTTAAIDGLLLGRRGRLEDTVRRIAEVEARESQQTQDGRGRGTGRGARGGQQSQWGQPGQGTTGQEQYPEQSQGRSRRR